MFNNYLYSAFSSKTSQLFLLRHGSLHGLILRVGAGLAVTASGGDGAHPGGRLLPPVVRGAGPVMGRGSSAGSVDDWGPVKS